MKQQQRQSGFSLVEMLVVVAIIGVLALVTVPNFMAMRRANMLKSSMRNFVADLRGLRQRSVTKHQQTKISFTNGSATTGRQYTLWELDPATNTWVQVGATRSFEQMCYVSTETNLTTPDSGTTYEIVYRPDGTAILAPGQFAGTAVIKTDFNLPKSTYTITVQYSGAVQVS